MNGRGMKGTFQRDEQVRRGVIVASPFLALLAAGCSGGSFFRRARTGRARRRRKPRRRRLPASAGLRASFPLVGQGAAKRSPARSPTVQLPAGRHTPRRSTLTIGPTGDKTAMTLRYQADSRARGRECAVFGGNMVMKVGIEGRVSRRARRRSRSGQRAVAPWRSSRKRRAGGTHPILTKFFPHFRSSSPPTRQRGLHPYREGITFPLPTPDPTRLRRPISFMSASIPVSGEAQAKPARRASRSRRRARIDPNRAVILRCDPDLSGEPRRIDY